MKERFNPEVATNNSETVEQKIQFEREYHGQSEQEQPVVYGHENTFVEINPHLTLERKNADVSYSYDGQRRQRNTNIYRDERGNQWYEIKEEPRKQMAIALLSQKFFNISTVIEIKRPKNKLSNFFININPQISEMLHSAESVFKPESRFISKKLDSGKVPDKDDIQIRSDFIVFRNIFDPSGDRDMFREHNFRSLHNSYAFFDFDHSRLDTRKEAEDDSLFGNDFSGSLYFIFRRYFSADTFGKKAEDFEVLNKIVAEITNKIKEISDFYYSSEGKEFFKAVLRKTKYLEEARELAKKWGSSEDKFDPDSLYMGLVIRIKRLAEEVRTGVENYYHGVKFLSDHPRVEGIPEDLILTSLQTFESSSVNLDEVLTMAQKIINSDSESS